MSVSYKRGLKVGVAVFVIFVAVRLIFDQVKGRDFDPVWVILFPAIVAVVFGVIQGARQARQK